MKSWKLRVAALIIGAWLLPVGVANAQQGLWPYQPARPTLSPYMGFLQRDTGPVGTYLDSVRPQILLRQDLTRQRYVIRQQGAAINVLGQEVLRDQTGQPRVPTTGTGGTYMQYSHYYPGLTTPPVRR